MMRLLEGAGGAKQVDTWFAEVDALAEQVNEAGEQILGALYDYEETIIPVQE